MDSAKLMTDGSGRRLLSPEPLPKPGSSVKLDERRALVKWGYSCVPYMCGIFAGLGNFGDRLMALSVVGTLQNVGLARILLRASEHDFSARVNTIQTPEFGYVGFR